MTNESNDQLVMATGDISHRSLELFGWIMIRSPGRQADHLMRMSSSICRIDPGGPGKKSGWAVSCAQ